jgi:hypothetical protein
MIWPPAFLRNDNFDKASIPRFGKVRKGVSEYGEFEKVPKFPLTFL